MPQAPWSPRDWQELAEIPDKQGLTPIIAHLDRYIRPMRTYGIPQRLEELPVLVQANASFFCEGFASGMAMKMLKSKLIEIKEREHLDKIEDIKGEQKEIGWGSQIRSYVFMPYTLAKDHRTGFEAGNINAVMDGDIDGFINAYLSMNAKK